MPKVSIVVPVYKVEKFIHRCVFSLLNQTLQDIEIILVDDGSPDNCPAICDTYARKDNRIKVVHKENGGLSSARNAGLSVATGVYVGFVDSDDDVEPDMYEQMYQVAVRENVDYVMSDFVRVLQDGVRKSHTQDIRGGRYDREDIRKNIFPSLIMGRDLEYGPCLAVWLAVYRREFLERFSIHFDEEVRWSEDNIFSAIVGYHANCFYYMKGCEFYHYYQNPGTITTSYKKESWNVYCTMNRHLHDFFDPIDEYDFSNQMKLHLIFYACCSIGQIKYAGTNFVSQVELIRSVMNTEALKEVFEDFEIPDDWPFKLKIQITLMKWKAAVLYRILVLR